MPGRETIPTPSQKFLLERLRYDRSTGWLVWKERPRTDFETSRGWHVWSSRFPGKRAGTTDTTNRYRRIAIASDRYFSHRLIWKMVYGEDPPGRVGHRDGDPSNDRLENLFAEPLVE